MKKFILEFIASLASSLYPSNSYNVRLVNNKPFIFKHTSDEGIAALLMYRVLWLFYIPFIEVTDIFYTFEEDEQNFILQHEYAHYIYKHYKCFYDYLSDDEMNKVEMYADLYATIRTNKNTALRALTKLEEICSELSFDTKYIHERIMNIERIEERAD